MSESARTGEFRSGTNEDIGRIINNRYKITEVIGEGGMGVVYEAYDMQVERDVAIKLVRRECLTDRTFLTRFRRELEVTSQFRHPSTIRVYEHGETPDGRPYMVMELLTGRSLAETLERDGTVPEMVALGYARQIAESLSEAHENEIFHRDLKPDNIFIESVGVSTVVKVLDFGIAGGIDAMRLTRAGEVFGTPQYMSPEQCNGQPLDHRTDIYSLGCILYEMIEGRPPFTAETPMATMLKHVKSKVPPPRNASQPTARLLQLALRKDRNKRIQTMGRFTELVGDCMGAVRAAEEGRPVPEIAKRLRSNTLSPHTPSGGLPTIPYSRDTPAPQPPIPVQGSGRMIAVILGVAALLLVGILVFQTTGGAPSHTESATTGAAAVDTAQPEEIEEPAPTAFPKTRPLITTNVDAATVLVDGVEVGTTPCEISVPVGDGEVHEIRLRKDGYFDVVQNWRPLSVNDDFPALPPMQPLEQVIEVGNGKKR
ncbi:MAG: serine/threonine protein kinase [Myxococcales bacterium]|nr:serine/threonine protein kinase [Myxococcales bacterium]